MERLDRTLTELRLMSRTATLAKSFKGFKNAVHGLILNDED